MVELKPCPFCGAEAVMETFTTAREGVPRFRARCKDCDTETSWDYFTASECAERWNRRAENG